MSDIESMATTYRRRAREIREAALALSDPGAQSDALAVAAQWDRMADAAEVAENRGAKPKL